MWPDNRILELLNIEHPIIQAPMAGTSNPDLIGAVSGAGGLGSYGAAATPPDRLREVIRAIRQRTDRPFNINLFSSHTENFDRDARPGPGLTSLLERYHKELGLGSIPEPGPLFGPFEEQLEVLVEEDVPVISFHFGADPDAVRKAQARGAKVLCSATTVAEARELEQAGIDAVIAQGAEAGGHRGTFSIDYRHALIGTLALVPQVADAVNIPVIAAGGIMDARGVVACLALGASGVQMGTAFLASPETRLPEAWAQSLKGAEAEVTTVTTTLSGKPARAIRTRYVEEVEQLDEPLLPYPAQYSVSRDLRAEALKDNNPKFLAMWAGQGVGMLEEHPAAQLIEQLANEAGALFRRLGDAQ